MTNPRQYCAVLALVALAGCGGGDDDAALPTTLSAVNPQAACSALSSASVDPSQIGLPTKGATITSAALVPQSSANTLGEYCLVQGDIAAFDVTAQPIKFSLALPTSWNRRALQLGGGGYDGRVVSPTGNPTTVAVGAPAPLGKGYAVFGDNGIGKWGDFTARDDIPMCALPPEDWQAKRGGGNAARGKKVAVIYKGSTVTGELRDTMPHKANITNGAGIDLNRGFAKAFGVTPPFMLSNVQWDWAE